MNKAETALVFLDNKAGQAEPVVRQKDYDELWEAYLILEDIKRFARHEQMCADDMQLGYPCNCGLDKQRGAYHKLTMPFLYGQPKPSSPEQIGERIDKITDTLNTLLRVLSHDNPKLKGIQIYENN